jgi:hypothetical protein
MTWTKSGTITVTSGSRIITGTGTSWIATVSAGEGFQGPDGRVYEIESVNSDVQLTLPVTSPYLGANASGQAYTILPTQDAMRALAGQAATLVNNFGAVKDNAFVRTDIDKATPIDTDAVALRDSVTGLGRLLTWSNLKSAIKTYLSGVAFSIGQTTPAAGAFTTLSATGNVSSNGKAYIAPDGTIKWGSSGAHGNLTWDANKAIIAAGDGNSLVLGTGGGSATLDTSGNLGLGVVPSAWGSNCTAFQVDGAALSRDDNADACLNLSNNAYRENGSVWKYAASSAAVRYEQGYGTGAHTWFTASAGTAGAPISFTQAMTLDASSNLLVGATGNTYVSRLVLGAGGNNKIETITDSTSNSYHLIFSNPNGAVGSIQTVGATATYNTTSDHRLKENVRPANAARFMDIEFVDFEWVEGRHDCGLIAHQLQSVYPDLVIGEKDATEVRVIELSPAVPAITEQRLVSPAIPAVIGVEATDAVEGAPAEYETVLTDEVVLLDGVETTITHSKVVEVKAAVVARAAVEAVAAVAAVEAVYETVVVTPAVEAVTEEQTFPVYQQVNYTGLIGRMGARVQQHQRTADAQAELIASLVQRLNALEAA